MVAQVPESLRLTVVQEGVALLPLPPDEKGEADACAPTFPVTSPFLKQAPPRSR